MGYSLSVYTIKSNLEKFTKSNEITLTSSIPKQKDMGSFGAGNKMPQAISIIKFDNESGGFRKYSVHQESNTIMEVIKVFKWDYLESGEERPDEENSIITDKGYQRVIDFPILIDIKNKLLYIFTKKEDAKLLAYRLNKNDSLMVEPEGIDLSKINLVSQITDEWGAWLDDTGEKLKKAYFGTKIKKVTEGQEDFVTTYIVTYEYSDINFDLIISRDGTISSNNKAMTNQALKKIFDNIRSKTNPSLPNID